MAQVFAVEPQQVERVEHRFRLPIEKLVEATDTILVEANNLAVQNYVVDRKFCEGGFQGSELEAALVSRDQPTLSALYIHQATETVMLQFKDEIGIVKRFTDELEAHRLDAGEHNLFYQGATVLLIL